MHKEDYVTLLNQTRQLKELLELCEKHDLAFDYSNVSMHLGLACSPLYTATKRIRGRKVYG